MSGARQPLALVQANGKKHFTKDEIKERTNRELKAASDNIVPPKFLEGKNIETFNTLAAELIKLKIMSNIDCNALGRYIISQSNYEKMTLELNNTNLLADIGKYERCAKMQGHFLEQCLRLEKEFGMTISSRCKLVAPKSDEKASPLLKALQDDSTE